LSNATVVSHLQFANDTLLLGVKSWANVCALRAVLLLFEVMSGLKVNFNKSMMVGVNISESWLVEGTFILNCRVGKVPFLYVGLSIGGDPRRLTFWGLVLHTIKYRLSAWKSRFLFFGGSFDSSKIRPDLSACLCPFPFQSFVRYNLFH